jgi:hypothetical protein
MARISFNPEVSTRRSGSMMAACAKALCHALVMGALLGGAVAGVGPARAQGPDDFLRDLNSIGIGNLDDKHNFDLVGFGNAICWWLYSGKTPSEVTEIVITGSGSGSTAGLTPKQAEAAVGFAESDLCPDAKR